MRPELVSGAGRALDRVLELWVTSFTIVAQFEAFRCLPS